MRRALACVSFVIFTFLSEQTAFSAQCVWGPPEIPDMPSVPTGVSLKSREISIGQSLEVATAAIKREFPGESLSSSEVGIDIDGRCKLRFVSQIGVYSNRAARWEEVTAEFGSPAMGSQLLAFERRIKSGNDPEYPLVDEITSQLSEHFGEPSATESHDYYFLYKDQRKIKVERGESIPCRASNLSLYQLMRYDQCDLIVYARFDVMDYEVNVRLERYREVRIRYLDLRRARIDAGIRERQITKIKEEFAAESRKRPPKDRI